MLSKWLWNCCLTSVSQSQLREGGAFPPGVSLSMVPALQELMCVSLLPKKRRLLLRDNMCRNVLASARQDGGGLPRSHGGSDRWLVRLCYCDSYLEELKRRKIGFGFHNRAHPASENSSYHGSRRQSRKCPVSRLLSSSPDPWVLSCVTVLPTLGEGLP